MSRWTPTELAQAISNNPHVRISRSESPQKDSKPITRSALGKQPDGALGAQNNGSGASPKPRKYRNEPVVHEGVKFDSKKEFQRYLDLTVMERAGEISDLKCHPKYVFEHNGVRIGSYKADFSYIEDGAQIIEDVKSEPSKTQMYRLRKRLLRAFYGLEVRET